MKRQKISVVVCISVFVFSIFALITSIFWPLNWNQLLGSTILNIFAGLIVLSFEIVVAIFIIEKYIEHEKQLRKNNRLSLIHTYFGGQLSINIDVIIHESDFILFGRNRWTSKIDAGNVDHQVPNNFPDFHKWLINVYLISNRINQDKLNIYKKAYNETPILPFSLDVDTFRFFINQMQDHTGYIRDGLFVIQPLVEDNHELLVKLISYVQKIEHLTNGMSANLALDIKQGNSVVTIDIGKFSDVKNLAEKSIESFEFIINFMNLSFLKKK